MKSENYSRYNLRLPTHLMDWVKKEAQINRRSIVGQIIFIIESYKSHQDSGEKL